MSLIVKTVVFDYQEINGSTITRELRRGAEYDYMKRYGAEWKLAQKDPSAQRAFSQEHCRFTELVSSKYCIVIDKSTPMPFCT